MTVIKLVNTPKKAFNPQRPAGKLLLSQIEHLEHAVGRQSKATKRTEGQAARYIAELTAELLRRAQEPTAPAPAPLAGALPAAASSAAAPAIATTMPGTKTSATKHHASPARTASARKATTPRRAIKKKKAPLRRRSR